jgi:glutathione synthase/RimK-type ligase-like ATP-grasp enzyme
MFDDKWLFCNFCKENGLPMPQTIFFSSKEEIQFREIKERLKTPFVVKL